ncbi:MAG TPA: hypothetical protein VGN83_15925 [Falsiroseomonas sp.]|jgi:hypothetical protein|nr:hypothetical protein [Falsiroseomonas sp.]
MRVCDLEPGDSITLQCAMCRATVRWSKAKLDLAIGARTDLNNIGLHEGLRCRGCGKTPSNAWPSWQQE